MNRESLENILDCAFRWGTLHVLTYEHGRPVIRSNYGGRPDIPEAPWYDVRVDKYGNTWVEPIGVNPPHRTAIEKVVVYRDHGQKGTFTERIQCYQHDESHVVLARYYSVYRQRTGGTWVWQEDYETHEEAQEAAQSISWDDVYAMAGKPEGPFVEALKGHWYAERQTVWGCFAMLENFAKEQR